MLDHDKDKKLMELASKAVSINKQLLQEEEEFISAVEQRKEVSLLEKMPDNINLLIRKEHLFLGALKRQLQKLSCQSE
jgi:hypothetical protein